MNNYKVFKITCTQIQSEPLIAELADIGFEGFIENDNGFEAYIIEKDFDEKLFASLFDKYHIGKQNIEEENIAPQNWNAQWEQDFEPIIINNEIAVVAPFHTLNKTYKYQIIIQPKNTFGTGHHETTQLVLEMMLSHKITNKQVFDYGCGTGVLGIFAAQLGAKGIVAIDIDEWCTDNVVENAKLNNINNLTFIQGTLNVLDITNKFDFILANINKNILADSFKKLSSLQQLGGSLVISGFYQSDLNDLIAESKKHGYTFVSQKSKNNWCAASFLLAVL